MIPIVPAQTSLTTADASSLGIPSLTDSNDLKIASSSTVRTTTESDIVRTVLPSPIIDYLDILTTVKEQFKNVPLSSCLPAVPVEQPQECLLVYTRTGRCTGLPNNATSICTSLSTSTSQKPLPVPEDSISLPDADVTRKTARALVYNIRTAAAADPFTTPASISEDPPEREFEKDGDNQGLSEGNAKEQSEAVPSPAPFNEESSSSAGDGPGPSNKGSSGSSAYAPTEPDEAPIARTSSSGGEGRATASPEVRPATGTGQESGHATDERTPPRQSSKPTSKKPIEGPKGSSEPSKTGEDDFGGPTTLSVPSFTLGGTVYTAAETLTSDQGLGGYIYSGIGGSGPAGTVETPASPSNATGVVPFTGHGSRSQLSAWVGYVVLGSTLAAVLR